ncbi:AsnC family transcriptional regulator [Pacificibacter marinus]|nr:AsnC family transcriptional regulator [Pacificibacter marinus]
MSRINKRILRLLQNNGRFSNPVLATQINVSPASCHRRI